MSQENINENNVEEVVDKKEEVVAEETSNEEVAAQETPVEADEIPVEPLVVGAVATVKDVAPALKSLLVIVVS